MSDPVEREHKAGGKTKMRLPAGVTGRAHFVGVMHEHRLFLEREWEPDEPVVDRGAYALWVGMNPSEADAQFDDLTCLKERYWTRQLGYRRYIKCNVASRCATQPKDLLKPGVEISNFDNMATILKFADGAARVILATGNLSKPLVPIFRTMIAALAERKITSWCLGETQHGYPKHSSRLAYATHFRTFRPLTAYDTP